MKRAARRKQSRILTMSMTMNARILSAVSLSALLLASSAAVHTTPLSAQAAAGADTAAVPPVPDGRRIFSWTADRRAFLEGDLLTVFVDERVVAAASADDYASDDRRMGRGGAFGSTRLTARLDGDTRSDERGVSERRERFQTEITVRVLEIQNGNLRVEGAKNFKVDDHEQEVILRGWVRPHDVTGRNVIDAWRVADLEFLYESNGELIKPKQGMLQRLLGIVF